MLAELGFAAGGYMARNLAISYGAGTLAAGGLSKFYQGHLDGLKASENPMLQRTGRVLEAAVVGYGIGYVAPVAIIAAGQLILGNPLQAAVEVGSAAVFLNPQAATCAALGALFYGYHALTDDEKAAFLETLQDGLEIGKQLLVSIIGFAERTLSDLLNSEALKALKGYVTEYAGMFGRSVADITRSVGDHVVLAAHRASDAAYTAAQSVGSTVYDTASNASALAEAASEKLRSHTRDSWEWVGEASTRLQAKFYGLLPSWSSDQTNDPADNNSE